MQVLTVNEKRLNTEVVLFSLTVSIKNRDCLRDWYWCTSIILQKMHF